MIRSALSYTLSFLFTSLLGHTLNADNLIIGQYSKLTGDIESIQSLAKGGAITILHPNSPSPISLKGEYVKQIEFTPSSIEQSEHHEAVILHTGEKLPCDILSLTQEFIEINTSYAGKLKLKKREVAKVTFDSKSSNTIYYGPNNSQEWDFISNWIYRSGHLTSTNKALAYQEFDLPESFIISFRLRWEEPPKFKLYFCTESQEVMKKKNRYMLFFDSSGLELKRVTPRRYEGMAAVRRRPDSFSNDTVLMQLKVDRKHGQITVVLDDEEIGTFRDKSGEVPQGNGFIFESTPRTNGSLQLSEINLIPWDGINALSNNQQDLNQALDSFYDHEGQFFTGQALSLERQEGQALTLQFKSPHAPQPMQIEASKLNSLCFPVSANAANQKNKAPIHIELSPAGEIFATEISLKDGQLSATHPTLGSISLAKSSVIAIHHSVDQPSNAQP